MSAVGAVRDDSRNRRDSERTTSTGKHVAAKHHVDMCRHLLHINISSTLAIIQHDTAQVRTSRRP